MKFSTKRTWTTPQTSTLTLGFGSLRPVRPPRRLEQESTMTTSAARWHRFGSSDGLDNFSSDQPIWSQFTNLFLWQLYRDATVLQFRRKTYLHLWNDLAFKYNTRCQRKGEFETWTWSDPRFTPSKSFQTSCGKKKEFILLFFENVQF